MWIMLPHWDYHHPSHLYSHVPYGRFNYFPDAYKYMPHDRHPLYYDVRAGVLCAMGGGGEARLSPGAPRCAAEGPLRPDAQPGHVQLHRPVPRGGLPAARGDGYAQCAASVVRVHPRWALVALGGRRHVSPCLPRPAAVNYVPPNYHPTWPGGKFNYPTRFSHAEGFHDLVPFDVRCRGWLRGGAP